MAAAQEAPKPSVITAELLEGGAQTREEEGYTYTIYGIDVEYLTSTGEKRMIQVWRRYSEFYELYGNIYRKYEPVYYSDMPKKCWWGSMAQSTIEDRNKRLAKWLQVVMGCEAKADPDVVAFLGVPSDADGEGEGGQPPAQPAAQPAAQPPAQLPAQPAAQPADQPPADPPTTTSAPAVATPAAGAGAAAAAAGPDPVKRAIEELTKEGLRDRDVLEGLVGFLAEQCQDLKTEKGFLNFKELVRELYHTQTGEAAAANQASVVCRQERLERWGDKVDELGEHYDKQHMANLLEACGGDVQMAQEMYDDSLKAQQEKAK